VRGTVGLPREARDCIGITPACAGNRLIAFSPIGWIKDHPRVCGEQQPGGAVSVSHAGSPPRVRGTVLMPERSLDALRITPACAGNRFGTRSTGGSRRDHPRVCGEQLHRVRHGLPLPGSPPRVRGTEPRALHLWRPTRITPACAGNSSRFCSVCVHLTDHPRVCGEQSRSMI